MSIVMGVDQHRAQITAEWIDLATGEISRARVLPADRAGVRRFLARFAGERSSDRLGDRRDQDHALLAQDVHQAHASCGSHFL